MTLFALMVYNGENDVKETIYMEDFMTLWIEFEEDILHSNRFFCNHSMLKHINSLATKSNYTLPKSSELFRARIISYDQIDEDGREILGDKYKKDNVAERSRLLHELGIHGFNAEHSGIPPKDITVDGRANPKYTPYFYLAKHPYTALAECKPYQFDHVSIATYITYKDLKLVDFRNFSKSTNENQSFYDRLTNELAVKFSLPVKGNNKDYIITQVISGYIKSLGYDGIIFMSSLHKKADNITLFSDDGCIFLRSDVYDINNIVFKTKPNISNHHAKDILPEELL